MGWPVSASHSRTVAVVAGAGQPVPVGAERHTAHRAGVAGRAGSPRGWPVSASHSRTVLSSLALASRCPSGLNATPLTAPVWPVSGSPRGWPVSASHSRTVPSALALARRCPSGLNATPFTPPVWPVSGCADGLAGVGVPQPHRAVVAGGGQPVPVGAERHTAHRVGVAGERGADRLAGVGVPQPHRAVVAGGGQPVPVGAERHTGHPVGVAGEGLPRGWPVSAFHSRTVLSSLALASRCPSGLNATPITAAGVAGERVAEGLAGVGVPQPHRAVAAGGGQPVPVGAERHTRHRAGVAGERGAEGLAGVGVPQPHRAVGAGGGQPVPVGAERHTRSPRRCGR